MKKISRCQHWEGRDVGITWQILENIHCKNDSRSYTLETMKKCKVSPKQQKRHYKGKTKRNFKTKLKSMNNKGRAKETITQLKGKILEIIHLKKWENGKKKQCLRYLWEYNEKSHICITGVLKERRKRVVSKT